MRKINYVLKVAKELLEKKQRNPAHDYLHHKLVWETCKDIIGSEKLNLNYDALKIAVFWHDVVVVKNSGKLDSTENLKKTVIFLTEMLRNQKFDKKTISIIKDATSHHEFGDAPISVEGKVLQDADKLEVLSKKRFFTWYNLAKNNKKEMNDFKLALRVVERWVPIMRDKFNFTYSKELFDIRLEKVRSDKRIGNILKRLDIKI